MIQSMTYNQVMRVMAMLSDTWIGDEHVLEQRFAGDVACVHCGDMDVVRFGYTTLKSGERRQRYRCKGCKKTFLLTTGTIMHKTKKPLELWSYFARCMAYRDTLRECASACGISLSTAFVWRHKILDAMGKSLEDTRLSGVIEADETFLLVSYKGNHRDRFQKKFGRKPHKRGHDIHTRGTSKEQVCVPCAIDRNQVSIAKLGCLGNPTIEGLKRALDGCMEPESTLVSDKAAAYRKLASDNNVNLVQVKGKLYRKGIYNIQRVNAYHSHLKTFLAPFYGVSTKYLQNYLNWFIALGYDKQSLSEQQEHLTDRVLVGDFTDSYLEVLKRPDMPLPLEKVTVRRA